MKESEFNYSCAAVLVALNAAATRVNDNKRAYESNTRERLDRAVWDGFGRVERRDKDDYVQEAIEKDETIYDAYDCLAAIYEVYGLVRLGGHAWTFRKIRRFVQRSLTLPSWLMNPDGTRAQNVADVAFLGCEDDPIASIDAGVDDLPIDTDATNGSDSNVLRAGARTGMKRPGVSAGVDDLPMNTD